MVQQGKSMHFISTSNSQHARYHVDAAELGTVGLTDDKFVRTLGMRRPLLLAADVSQGGRPPGGDGRCESVAAAAGPHTPCSP